jgi:hypothetical protein
MGGGQLSNPLLLGDGRGDVFVPLGQIGQETFVIDIDRVVADFFLRRSILL